MRALRLSRSKASQHQQDQELTRVVMNQRSVALRRAVVGALALASVPAFAQLAPPTSEMRSIETIVITAQKREQSLQDVPIVVTTIGEQSLRDTTVRDIKDLMILTPGLL